MISDATPDPNVTAPDGTMTNGCNQVSNGRRSADSSTRIVALLVLILLVGALWGTFSSGREGQDQARRIPITQSTLSPE